MSLDLRQLISFREVVRTGSFTAAGRVLHMTQPAISLHIKSLEKHLESRLLLRASRGVELTETGRLLLEATERVLADLEDVTRQIAEIEAPERGTVVLACGDTVALNLLPPVLSAFRAQFPLARVHVINQGSKGVIETVLRREADLGIITRAPFVDPALQVRTILREPFHVAIPLDHPLAQEGDPLAPESLADHDAVLLAASAETRALIDRELGRAGITPRVVMESGNLEVVKAYVASGLGYALLPALALTSADEGRFHVRALPEGRLERELAVVRLSERRPGQLVAGLLSILAETLATRGGASAGAAPGSEEA